MTVDEIDCSCLVQGEQHGAKPVRFRHANAETTGLPAESADLVTLCLVAHELPADATANIFQEAYRLLRPGGSLAVMEVPAHLHLRHKQPQPHGMHRYSSDQWRRLDDLCLFGCWRTSD